MVKKQDQGPRCKRIWADFLRRPQAQVGHTPSPTPSISPLPAHELELLKIAYLCRLREKLAQVYLYGLDERRHLLQSQGHTLDFEALYIPLSVLRPTWYVAPEQQERPGTFQATSTIPLLQVAGRERRLIVRGSPGSAHSTFLQYLALKMAQTLIETHTLHPEWGHGRLFPLLIPLETCALAHKGASPTADMLLALVADQFKLTPAQLEEQIIAPGGLLWLIDNLECAATAVHELYHRFAATESVWIITAQEAVNHNDELTCMPDGFAQVRVAPITTEQIDAFIHQWYAELLRKGWIDQEQARDLPGQIVAQLRRPEVETLARHRSLLSLIVLLHTLHGRLPPTPTLFYHQLARLAISCWVEGRADGERDLRSTLSVERLAEAVAQMTYQLYLERPSEQVELSENDLRVVLTGACQEGQWAAVGELISRLLTRPTLIEERRRGVFVFAHPNLQAYVISNHLANHPELPRLSVRLAREAFHRWNEPITLAIGRLVQLQNNLSAALEVIDALCPHPLPDPSPTDGHPWRLAWLAGRGLLEIERGNAAQEQPFPTAARPTLTRVKVWLTATLEQERLTPYERAQAGRVLACLPGGDERVGVSTPEGIWCEVSDGPFWFGEGEGAQAVELGRFWMLRYPVTNAQYAHFVEATGYRIPAHWSGSRPPDALANHPVVHISWHDAQAYAQWLNDRLRALPVHIWRHGRVETLPAFPTGMVVRLPGSLEWEKAARGGIRIPTAQGNGWMDNPLPRRIYPVGRPLVAFQGRPARRRNSLQRFRKRHRHNNAGGDVSERRQPLRPFGYGRQRLGVVLRLGRCRKTL